VAAPGARIGQAVAGLLSDLGVEMHSVRRDLRVVGRSFEHHVTEKLVIALTGLLLLPAMTAIGTLIGVHLSLLIPLWGSLALGVAGFFVPDLTVHTQAEERRRSFRYALGSFFDLVVITLAGGGGVESALYDAAHIGQGWAYAELQRTLALSRMTGETPWAALGRLGDELGVGELNELAASVGLAGTEGARVRESLTAKAASLRAHELSEAEADAESASERMSLPVVLLFVGFLIFLGYPAIDTILNGI
jgi:Flp pilus assembly protein TadB